MTDLDDPKLVVKDLLETEWVVENTPESSAPDFRTGWRDSDLTQFQITASHDEESPTSPTGYTGMGPDGPTSERRGTVQVNVWTRRDLCDANPKTSGYEFTEEIERILDEWGYRVSSYPGWSINSLDASNYRYLSWLGREHMPETPESDDVPLTHRHLVTLGYEYLG